MQAYKARKPATSHIFMGMPQLAFAICGSKEYLVNMQENKNKSEKWSGLQEKDDSRILWLVDVKPVT